MNWQKPRLALATLTLLTLSVAGFWGVDTEWRSADGLAAQLSAFAQIVYSLLGLVAIVLLFMKSRWGWPVLYLWAGAMIFTGATAPVIWAGAGWGMALLATTIMVLVAGGLIGLAPLPAPAEAPKPWRRLGFATLFPAVLVVFYVAGQFGPLAVSSGKMERFCEGVRDGITAGELQALAEREGYVVRTGTDAQGPYLRIDAGDSPGAYYCEARFKQDGSIAVMHFTATAKK